MNISLEKRLAILSIFFKGVNIETIQVATGIDRNTIASIIQHANTTKGKKMLAKEIEKMGELILRR